jgi:hypothetical protein
MRRLRQRSAKDAATVAPAVEDPGTRDLSAVRAADLEVKIPRQHFPLGVVASSLALVLRAATRLRSVSQAVAMSWSWQGMEVAAASYYTVRMWLLRLGLYQLNRPKQKADDWIWILDHTMQVGPWKCLLILGIRQSAWDANDRVLSHEDVDVIDLQPVTTSTEEVVYEQLKAATAITGVPRELVSDDGRDFHAARARFCEAHPTTVWLDDIKHKTACLLERELKRDPSWKTFVEEVNRFKQRVSVTPLARLMPPQQRGKARYMNIDILVEWAQKHLAVLDRPDVLAQVELDVAVVEEKLGWLREFAPDVRRWGDVLDVIGTTEHYVRHEGIHRDAGKELATALPKPASEPARRLRKELLEFIRQEAKQAKPGERLLGSSEVIESVFGKFKDMAGERGRHGLTGMVLSIGALVGHTTIATVHTALSQVTNNDVWDWCESHLGLSVQGARRAIARALCTEQKQKPLPLPDS